MPVDDQGRMRAELLQDALAEVASSSNRISTWRTTAEDVDRTARAVARALEASAIPSAR